MLKRITGEKDSNQEEENSQKNGEVATELESLRSILYGNQAKATDERLDTLRNHLDAVQRELSTQIKEGLNSLRMDMDAKINNLEKKLTENLSEQAARQNTSLQNTEKRLSEETQTQNDQHTTDLRAAQRQQSESLDKQNEDQTNKLRILQKTLTERVDALSSDIQTKTVSVEKELSNRLETLKNEQGKQIEDLAESGKRNNTELKGDLLMLASSLENNKVSGSDLSNLLIELGHRLQKPAESKS
ncbi:MAG: hypothetical protein GY755_10165 [Chloroflexi bacterium]|nr:hypothetical protein [Chloroflexota bacterium]